MGKPVKKTTPDNVTVMFEEEQDTFPSPKIQGFTPRSDGQKALRRAIGMHDVCFGLGTFGTGKTFVPVAMGVEGVQRGFFEKVIFVRPAVESGEKLGSLPGDGNDKIAPFMMPMLDCAVDFAGKKTVDRMQNTRQILLRPIAHMRGSTLSDAMIVVDEAQNCTYGQLKMIYTRLGHGSKIVFVGDPDQSDIGQKSGLMEMVRRIGDVEGIATHRMGPEDIVRHPILSKTAHLI
ncbi:Phosphate starvation-inducible protein PhoH, predicted ATPase [Salipiger mucosus DSM 16094]|uniref:PhoH-like protein n=1 Tax=Salipiger mucosus DSM 16094 TaxID=1123237 RepID=S9SBD6_9RHOB|nr:Phosphate starvation-inducible protein PhoH, predicted ATPase [Salipiger mucosus DSM 16094]